MKLLLLHLILCLAFASFAQIPSYYNNVNLNASGQHLKQSLANKITSTHTRNVSYTPGVWNALKQSDLSLNNRSKVRLIYGYNDYDGNSSTDRTRNKYANGGSSTDWNREHVYPKSLGTPNLGTSGPGTDLHHLCPADVRRNSSRNNRKFADGAGHSTITAQGHWYPGDEYKGDVARIILYMYLRYGSRCLPKNVGVGANIANDANMIQLFLKWNVEDPVSSFEDQRNNSIASIQGNRNPFIDNPVFATQIWGGQPAEDRFGTGNNGGGTTMIDVRLSLTFDNYPEETSWEITNSSNQIVHSGSNYGNQSSGSTIHIQKSLAAGCYNLIIRDSYGDGMCCNYGNGRFVFTNLAIGNTITSGGRFNTIDSKAFCVGNSNARSSFSNIENTPLPSATSSNWHIYPNPVYTILTIEGTTFNNSTYQIVNTAGQLIQTGRLQKQIMLPEQLESGVYFLVIQDSKNRWIKKFIRA